MGIEPTSVTQRVKIIFSICLDSITYAGWSSEFTPNIGIYKGYGQGPIVSAMTVHMLI
jgi:hypothetical protein